MKLWGFLRFEMNAHKPFSICGYSFQNELGFQRDGSSFGAGAPIGAGSTLLAGESKGDSVPLAVVSKGGGAALAGRIQRNRRFRGTRLCLQSLVCYTFGDRGWRKGVVRGRNKLFPSATEHADSASSRTRSPGVCDSRIRLFGCRWCGGAERISLEILGAQQHHRGSQRYIIPRPAAATHSPSPRHFGNAIVFCFGRSFRSELRISSMALFANL